MRKLQMLRLLSTALLTVCAALPASYAFADSYTVYRVAQSSGSIDNVGWADLGSLVTFSASTLKYSTFTPPASSVTSTTPPALVPGGTSCTPAVGGITGISQGTCTSGWSAFSGYSGSNFFPSLFVQSPTLTLQMLYGGPVSNVLLDSLGDVAFVGLSGLDADTNFLYIDTTTRAAVATTPEPSSLLLLETGCVGAVALWRRRRQQA